mgnify:CR=1 FL=1
MGSHDREANADIPGYPRPLNGSLGTDLEAAESVLPRRRCAGRLQRSMILVACVGIHGHPSPPVVTALVVHRPLLQSTRTSAPQNTSRSRRVWGSTGTLHHKSSLFSLSTDPYYNQPELRPLKTPQDPVVCGDPRAPFTTSRHCSRCPPTPITINQNFGPSKHLRIPSAHMGLTTQIVAGAPTHLYLCELHPWWALGVG